MMNFVRRQANDVVYKRARASLHFVNFQIFDHIPNYIIHHIILNEMK